MSASLLAYGQFYVKTIHKNSIFYQQAGVVQNYLRDSIGYSLFLSNNRIEQRANITKKSLYLLQTVYGSHMTAQYSSSLLTMA